MIGFPASPLFKASAWGFLDLHGACIDHILREKNLEIIRGETPLVVTAWNDQHLLCHTLLMDRLYYLGDALKVASANGHEKTVRMVMENDVDQGEEDSSKVTALRNGMQERS